MVELVGRHQRGHRPELLDLAQKQLVGRAGGVDDQPGPRADHAGAGAEMEPPHHQRMIGGEEVRGELAHTIGHAWTSRRHELLVK